MLLSFLYTHRSLREAMCIVLEINSWSPVFKSLGRLGDLLAQVPLPPDSATAASTLTHAHTHILVLLSLWGHSLTECIPQALTLTLTTTTKYLTPALTLTLT